MKFDHVPIRVATENADATALMLLGGVAVAALLVALSAPRLFAFSGLAGGVIAGGLLIG